MDNEAKDAAADGQEQGHDGFPELVRAEIAVPVKDEGIREDAEGETGGEADQDAGRAADESPDDAAGEGKEARDDLGHDGLPAQVVPVEEDVLDGEVKRQLSAVLIRVVGSVRALFGRRGRTGALRRRGRTL